MALLLLLMDLCSSSHMGHTKLGPGRHLPARGQLGSSGLQPQVRGQVSTPPPHSADSPLQALVVYARHDVVFS